MFGSHPDYTVYSKIFKYHLQWLIAVNDMSHVLSKQQFICASSESSRNDVKTSVGFQEKVEKLKTKSLQAVRAVIGYSPWHFSEIRSLFVAKAKR